MFSLEQGRSVSGNSELPLYPLGLRHALTKEQQVVVICPEEEEKKEREQKQTRRIQPHLWKQC